MKILDQWRKKAALHSGNAVFIEMGNDFAFALKQQLIDMYENYKVRINFQNFTVTLILYCDLPRQCIGFTFSAALLINILSLELYKRPHYILNITV